jgi:hypothetical protein
MKTLAFALLLAVAGCSSAVEAPGDFTTPTPEADAGHDVIAPPTPGTDAAPTVDGGAGPDGQAADAQHEADATPAIDAGSKVDAVPDAGTSPEATPPTVDAGTTDADAAPPRVDAGSDAAPPSSDAATADVDAGNSDPICPDVSKPACKAATQSDDMIRATFTQPCSNSGVGSRMCGGVDYGGGVVETLPMLCINGQWRLAGSWSGLQWVTPFTCSTGCAAGKLCTP